MGVDVNFVYTKLQLTDAEKRAAVGLRVLESLDSNEVIDLNDSVLVPQTPPTFEPIHEIDMNERTELLNLYLPMFPNICLTILDNWVATSRSIGYYHGDVLVGAVTFRELAIYDIKFVDVLLIAVGLEFRRQGIGSKLLLEIESLSKRAVVWADHTASKFYKQNNFCEKKNLWYSMQTIIPYCTKSDFSFRGFTKEEIKLITDWGKAENAKFK
jgi:GNAT superfamily N-acetyltransferase